MKGTLKIIGICMVILFSVLFGLYAVNSAMKISGGTQQSIDFSYYEDAGGKLDAGEINNLFLQGKFTESKSPDFNFGRSRSAFWLRISAADASAMKNYIAVYCPNIQNVRLYVPAEKGYSVYASGWENGAIRKDEQMTYPVFALNRNLKAHQAVYLRIQSEYSHVYAIGFYNGQELNRARIIDYCLNSFIFGILLLAAVSREVRNLGAPRNELSCV